MPLYLNKRGYIFFMKILLSFVLLFAAQVNGICQNLLNRQISLEVKRQKLSDVLEIISNRGNFYFSYNSNIVKRDSLVTLVVTNKTVQYVLNTLVGEQFEFKESGNHIIIRRKPIQLTVTTIAQPAPEKYYRIDGYVSDGGNGEKLKDVSVYEKTQLISALSNEQGYFKLRLKSRNAKAQISVSKEYYYDTAVTIQGGSNQQLDLWLMPIETAFVTIAPTDYKEEESITQPPAYEDSAIIAAAPADSPMIYLPTPPVKDSASVDKRFLSKLFVSSKQKIQSLNLSHFFTTRPYQVSVIPGLGTQGRMSGQVVNHFSLNVLGGYTGGLNGFEMGGLLNINKTDAAYVQLAGLFNLTGGQQKGLQLAGIANTVLDSAKAVMVAGISNFVKGKVEGVQLSGIHNHATQAVQGWQVAGITNVVQQGVTGAQIGGIGNMATGPVKGAQIAGIFNYAGTTSGAQVAGIVNYTNHLRGLQIGLINIADTSDGYSIGLLNFVRRGYHKITAGPTESVDFQVAFKSGNRKLYSILLGSMNLRANEKLYAYGYGIGKAWIDHKRFALSTDLTAQNLYMGSWEYLNLLNTLSLQFNVKLAKGIALYGGPSFNYFISKQPAKEPGYAFYLPRTGFGRFSSGRYGQGWGGWQVGISLF